MVPDTSVLVSALLQPLGNCGQVLRAWRQGKVELVICPELLAKLAEVLARPTLRRRVSTHEADSFVALLSAQAELRADPEHVARVTADPADDYVIALARAARADLIVSGDAHLTGLISADAVVLSPAALVERLTSHD